MLAFRQSARAHKRIKKAIASDSIPVMKLGGISYQLHLKAQKRHLQPEKSSHAVVVDDPSRLPVIRVPGDGRCLFRSVVYGACLRSGDPSPSHAKQKQLADDLRNKVVDEFIKRRSDTEWFLEGDFEAYTGQMRKPHIWGGEPELLMSSHVLRMPIRVVMQDKKNGGVKVIAEYGQEYGKESPIQVMYHGYGHYDVLKTSPISTFSHS